MRALCYVAALATSCVVACGPPPPASEPAQSLALPSPPDEEPDDAAGGAPRSLPGIDTSGLTTRERDVWWSSMTSLFAPCPSHAVSLAQCLDEGRDCSACAPAAELLLDHVRAGASSQLLYAAYSARFGPDVKTVAVGDSPALGPDGAPVTIAVWHDFECPACRAAMPFLDDAVAAFPDQVRLVHKFYPLPKHTHALPAARAAVAAHAQDEYWAMEKKLFDNQHALTSSDLERYAEELELDMQRFRDDMLSADTEAHIDRDRADANALGLNGTPFILINGREFSLGVFRLDADLKPWIELELEMARAATVAE